jgi:glycosyltransferase involved in cell wall biosynthesis
MQTLTETNLREQPLSLPLHTATAVIDNFLIKNKSFPGLISLTRDLLKDHSTQRFQNSALLHLHWINGVLNPSFFAQNSPGQPIVWTMHDMNPFTGACHQSFGCEGYMSKCESCPAVKDFAKPLISHHLKQKVAALRKLEKLIVVAPNPWLAAEARRSEALHDVRIETIANPVRSEFFLDGVAGRTTNEQRHFTLIANDTTDPLKNVQFAVDAFRKLRELHSDAALHLIGKGSQRFQGEPGVQCTESMEPSEVRHNLRDSLGLLVPSLAENAPLVIAEAAVGGVPALVNRIPSLHSMVDWLGFGDALDSQHDWVSAMSELLINHESTKSAKRTKALAIRAKKLFEPTSVAQSYIALYEDLI